MIDFQLPLSGSRDHTGLKALKEIPCTPTFNSLSRDHITPEFALALTVTLSPYFQLPLSGSRRVK